MAIIQVIFLILLWGISIILFITFYRKATKEEKLEIINDLKRPSSLFGLGLVCLGVMLWFSGSIVQIKCLHDVGAIMLVIGGLNTVIVGWIKQEVNLIRGIWAILWVLAFTIAFIYLA